MLQRVQSTSNKRSKNSADMEYLDAFDIEEEGFTEGGTVTGKVLSAFSFGMAEAFNDNNVSTIQAPVQEKTTGLFNMLDQSFASAPRGLTPPIDGEYFTVKRSYAMRPSIVRKLNALKAEHPDVNVLFNTIVDMAISHYYNYIFNEGKSFGTQEEKKKNS